MKFLTKFMFILNIVMVHSITNLASAQLQQSNSIHVTSADQITKSLEISPPRRVEVINMKFDTTDIFLRGKETKIQKTDEDYNTI